MTVAQMDELLDALFKMRRIAERSAASDPVDFRFDDIEGGPPVRITLRAGKIKEFMAEYLTDCVGMFK